MRKGQEEHVKEILTEIQEQPTEEEKVQLLFRRLKEERRTFLDTIQTILTVIFCLGLVFLFIQGHFTSRNIDVHIDCTGKPINDSFKLIFDEQGDIYDVLENNISLGNRKYKINITE